MIPSPDWYENIEKEIERVRRYERELLIKRAHRDAKRGIYRCSVCLIGYVHPEDGEDTCSSCRQL